MIWKWNQTPGRSISKRAPCPGALSALRFLLAGLLDTQVDAVRAAVAALLPEAKEAVCAGRKS